MNDQDPSISPNAQSQRGLVFRTAEPTRIVLNSEPPNTIECPEHGEQVIMSVNSWHQSDPDRQWNVRIGCSKCFALTMRDLVRGRATEDVPF